MSTAEPRLSVVIVTRNRLPELLTTLGRLHALPEEPRVVVVDNASSDGTPQIVRCRYPDAEVISLDENLEAAGRNVGVEHVDTPYVAFSDDDSWWALCSLSRAADLFEAHPRLALLQHVHSSAPRRGKIPSAPRWTRASCRPSRTCPARRSLVFSLAGRRCDARPTSR